MPVKISVDTTSQIEIGAMAMKVSFTPGVGILEDVALTFALRGPTMWKLIGRPVSSISRPERLVGRVPQRLAAALVRERIDVEAACSPSLAMRLSSAMPSSMSTSGTCARPTRRVGAAFDSSTIQSL